MVCAIYVTSLEGGGGRCCRGAEVPKHFEGLSHARTSNGDCRTAKQNFSSGRMVAEFLAWMQQVASTISNFLFYLNLYASQWFLCVIRVFLDWPVYRPVIDARGIWINLLIWWPCYCEQGDRRLFSHSVLFNIILMEFSCCVVWVFFLPNVSIRFASITARQELLLAVRIDVVVFQGHASALSH